MLRYGFDPGRVNLSIIQHIERVYKQLCTEGGFPKEGEGRGILWASKALCR